MTVVIDWIRIALRGWLTDDREASWKLRALLGLVVALVLALPAGRAIASSDVTPAQTDSNMHFRLESSVNPTRRTDSNSTADHSKYDILKGPFSSGSDVTRACLSCHTEAGTQFMKSIHWTWEYHHPKTGQKLGKKTLINNYCTNARGNEGMCAQCHAGYGWKDDSFDFGDASNIDCLVCHDRTGKYYKTPNSAGDASCSIMFEGKEPIDWTAAAQSVGLPGRENCGSCHFFGGGGDGVKHGDLDSSLIHPPKTLDVHMSADGQNFSCSQCHVSHQHQWAGSRYNVIAKDTEGTGLPGLRRDVATCESCHGDSPHKGKGLTGIKLNNHVDRVACQTCHIPEIARGGVATMVDWDWRTAGKTKDGIGYKEKEYTQGNGEHRATYKSIKGNFKYAEDVPPYYAWFDGQMVYTTIDTTFDPAQAPIDINHFEGAANDPASRIWPFKRMHTVQPYDKGRNTLVYLHLWGEDDKAFWGNYNFADAIDKGMSKNDIDYSGEYGFIDTLSYWPITHMVAPAEQALACNDCHSRNGRLAELDGFYMPGRDANFWVDAVGLLMIFGSLGGVAGHGLVRWVAGRRRSGL